MMMQDRSARYIDDCALEFQRANSTPIEGYKDMPCVPLEQAVESLTRLVPSLQTYVSTAKEQCNKNSNLLSLDESAAIYLYTMPTNFFKQLNETLREQDRHLLKPWFSYLRLFLGALEKLPSERATIWRGVGSDVKTMFRTDKEYTWWSVNSCSDKIATVQGYVEQAGTVFSIDAINAKSISEYSHFPMEEEMILIPGTKVTLKSMLSDSINKPFILQMKETSKDR